MPSCVYTGDIGAILEVDTQNTSSPTTTTFTLIITKPSGATSDWGGTMDYNTGILTYETLSGDLDEAGQYLAQVRSVSSDGTEILKSDIDTFTVYEPTF